jgi:hypothetical protein
METEWTCKRQGEGARVELEVFMSRGARGAVRHALISVQEDKTEVQRVPLQASLRLYEGRMILRYLNLSTGGTPFLMELELPDSSRVHEARGELAFSSENRLYKINDLECHSSGDDGFVFMPSETTP